LGFARGTGYLVNGIPDAVDLQALPHSKVAIHEIGREEAIREMPISPLGSLEYANHLRGTALLSALPDVRRILAKPLILAKGMWLPQELILCG